VVDLGDGEPKGREALLFPQFLQQGALRLGEGCFREAYFVTFARGFDDPGWILRTVPERDEAGDGGEVIKPARRSAKRREIGPCLAIAPPSAAGSSWMRRFGPSSRVETGFASGWMQVRGIRRRRGYGRGFVISDHADWLDLLRTIRETGARRVLATHGSTETLAAYVRECMGLDSQPLEMADGAYGAEE
jgi:hypothetical protein